MAIVPLHRLTLIGELKYREQVLLKLQRLGCIHVVDLSGAGGRGAVTGARRDDLKSAIAYLERCPDKRPASSPPLVPETAVVRPDSEHWDEFSGIPESRRSPARAESDQPDADVSDHDDVKQIAAKVLQIESETRSLAEEEELLSEKIEQTRPWGSFRLPHPNELRGQRFFFFRLTHQQAREVPPDVQTNFGFNLISSDRQHQYWIAIAKEPPPDMPCPPEDLDPRSLAQMESRVVEIDEQRERLQLDRIALTRWLDRLQSELGAIEDEAARMIATHRSLVDGPVFALQGWVPRRQLAALEAFALQNTLALISRPPEPDEQPPTLLSNPRPISGAEGAVTFFMTPGYRAWDPTWVMFFSFALFFAMIMADAGYGLVLGLILAFAAKPLGRTESGRRFRQLAVFMVLVTIGYGVLIGSFFGFGPPAGSWLDRLVIKSGGHSIAQDREAMMLVSATIGVFHLVLANAVVAWRWLGSGHALAPLGWVIALVGGWLLTLARLPKPDVMKLLAEWFGGPSPKWTEAAAGTGGWMLGIGLLLVFLFSSTRPVFSSSPRVWLLRAFDGLMGLTSVTKAFGDALSYLRLFALGLASAQLAVMFNQMASDAAQVQGVGILLGLLIFLLGHAMNLVLAVVGGVVHGLRLNCIEFFSWSLTDEGQPFEAFEMKANK